MAEAVCTKVFKSVAVEALFVPVECAERKHFGEVSVILEIDILKACAFKRPWTHVNKCLGEDDLLHRYFLKGCPFYGF